MDDELTGLMQGFRLSDPVFLSQSPIARVWRVRCNDGRPAVLKHYSRVDRGNEAASTCYLDAMRGRGVVRVLSETQGAILLECLDGPSLGDLARQGEEAQASEMLAQVARRLHQPPYPPASDLTPLVQAFSGLFETQIAPDCSARLRADIERTKALVRNLLSSQAAQVPLHGDLHHDNVILTSDGPIAFDPKGYVGDPAFELANALRHPRRMPETLGTRAHIEARIRLYADALNVPTSRLTQWAAAKCALSIAWRAKSAVSKDREAGLLRLLLSLTDQ